MTHKTQDLILELADELDVQASVPSPLGFMAGWGLAGGGLVALSLLFQIREDLGARVEEARFWFESGLWLLSAATAALLVYRSSIPSLLKKGDQRWGGFVLAAVLGLLIFRLLAFGLSTSELQGEMDLWRGRCGPIILGMGVLAGYGFYAWARRAAPTRLGLAGFWSAISAGCLGSFAMQIVCAHDNALHVWIWHVTPVVLLALIGSRIAPRLLRW